MNLFRFLTSTRGAIKSFNAFLISAAAGGVFFYTVNTAANKQIAAERSVRTLSSISQTSPQEGMLRQGNLLTSINVRDGRNQLATAQERAAMEGNTALDRYNANQRALGSVDGSFGRAAQFSGSDPGLNTGNREAFQTPVQLAVGNPNAPVSVPAGGENPGSYGLGAEQPQPQRLTPASMTRASGNPSGSTSGAVSGGIVSQGGTVPGSEEGPRRLSGAMPGGSNIVSSRGLDGALAGGRNFSSFGRDRDGRTGRGRNGKGDRDELKDIVKRSADAAGNAYSSANEGGRAFLANARNSGGVSVSGGEESQGSSSGDLAAPTARKLRAIGNKISDLDKEQKERQAAQKALVIQLIATVLGSIGMMVAGALVLSKLDWLIEGYELSAKTAFLPADKILWETKAKILKIKRWILAGVMMATVTAANTLLFINAAKFANKYGSSGGTNLAKLAILLSPIMVAGMVFTAVKPTGWKNLLTNIWTKIKASFEPVGLLTGQVTNGIMGLFK